MTDRELVEAAAQHVMGWRVHCRNTAHWVDARLENSAGAIDYVVRALVNEWNPLESIANAWMLVDKLHGDGWEATVVRHKRGCTATFESRGAVEHSAESETAPRAITLAALRAKGEACNGKE